nr:cyclic nucleotide-binding domain-containing protein [uncultured Holophaga sp.]
MPEIYDLTQLILDAIPELAGLLERCPELEALVYRDGEYLMREGEVSQDLFLVLEGAYVVTRAPEAQRANGLILATVSVDWGEPSIVGEMAYFGAQRRSASVRSTGRTLALRLNAGHIDTIVEAFPGLLRLIFRQFSQRLAETNRSLEEVRARFALDPVSRLAPEGECLFSLGEPAERLFQVAMGSLRLEGAEGTRLVGPVDLPEGFLGLDAYLKGGRHTFTATVVSSAFLLEVGADHRQALVRAYPGLVLERLERSGA